MARQRFIHPSMWTDKTFGALRLDERILFIALFSHADDEGLLVADPGVLRGQAFAFDDFSLKKVRAIRDSLVQKMPNVHLYEADGCEYIALLKWTNHQRPQYPKPTKLPRPFAEASTKDDGGFHPRVGLGRDGLDRDGLERATKAVTEASCERPESTFHIPLKAVEGGEAA